MKRNEKRFNVQKSLAVKAFWFMVIFTCALFLPTAVVGTAKLAIIADVSTMVYITCGSIIGVFIGGTAYSEVNTPSPVVPAPRVFNRSAHQGTINQAIKDESK